MKICIFGAGAVGSFYGGELARAGQDVTLIGRGAHLDAMKKNGLTIRMNGEERHSFPACTDDPATPGVQEAVIFVVKAHQLEDAARQAAPLMDDDTIVVAAQNGIPWWYGYREGGALEGAELTAIDPDKRIWNLLRPERTIGAIINGSCSIAEPGIIAHPQKSRALTLGEPDGTISERCQALAAAFAETDIDVPVTGDIREKVWEKIMSNIGGSMVCVLTGSTIGRANSDPGSLAVMKHFMEDANRVSARLGYDLSAIIAKRVKGSNANSPHKPSTLQDLDAGKVMEIDAIVGAVAEIGRLIGEPTPVIDGLYWVLRRLAEERGCYPADSKFTLPVP